MPARQQPIKRAIRKTTRKRRNKRRGQLGKKFFLSMLFILAFVVVYQFFWDDIQTQLGIQLEGFGSGSGSIILAENEILVSFIDVGQGESILIRSRNNAVLIDGGEHRERNAVLGYLRNAGVRRLCYVVATHPHSDHIGGLITVLGRLEIGNVVMPDVINDTPTFDRFLEVIENNNIPVIFPLPGDRLQAGIIDLLIIAPPNPHPGPARNPNNGSIVLRLEHGQNSFMFTGDAERELENWMVSSDIDLSANVLNLGHHGSRTSTTEAFLDAVNPRVAVISVGANNTYNHPHPEVMERLNARNVNIYRTDQLGTIRMITDGYQISILR